MKKITPAELKDWMSTDKSFILIDVREEWEHANFSIGGNNIPLGEIITRKKEIDPQQTAIIYCEKGIRSVIAIQRLEAEGYANLYNLQGGMSAWKMQP